MLERTAGCLESSSLRRLLPVSRISVRSRRTLHSGFWNHGAGDSELYPLWALMVHGAELSGQQQVQEYQQLSSNSNATLLDFLYPVATLNFIRNFSTSGTDKQEGRWMQPWRGRAGSRGYTSSAKINGVADHGSKTDTTKQDGTNIPMYEDASLLYDRFSLEKEIDFEEAWRQYKLLEADEQIPLRKLMIRYISKSERIVDAERVTELFESLDQNQRDQGIYHQAIKSYLKLRNLAYAMQLYRLAIEDFQIPTGAEDILQYHLSNQSWSRAFKFWKSVQELCHQSTIARNYDIYSSIEAFPRFHHYAFDLAKYVDEKIKPVSLDASPEPSNPNRSELFTDPRDGQFPTLKSAAITSHGFKEPLDARASNSFFLPSEKATTGIPAKFIPQTHEMEQASGMENVFLNGVVSSDQKAIPSSGEVLGMNGAKNNKQALPPGVASSDANNITSHEASLNVAHKSLGHATVYADDVLAEHADFVQFAFEIIHRALLSTKSLNRALFIRLLRYLHKWQLDGPSLYERVISLLFNSRNTNLIPICYRLAHSTKDFHLSRRALNTILSVFCDKHDTAGIKMVLDDFFSLHSRPDRLAYRMCLKEFSRQGDVRTVHALFEQYSSRYLNKNTLSLFKGQRDNADEFIPILHVHARRGEVAEVKAILTQIEDVYGLQPTIKCWNILLDAHSKVHEYDKAFEIFENLINDPNLRLNSYTIGTIMGMCASHGDLERTQEIYELSRRLKVEETTPMTDALILAYLRDGKLEEAQEICLATTERSDIKGSKTRMWNYILNEYAMRRDLESVNRIIQRMAQLNIEFDEYTYAMLMQALAMVGQANQAWKVLKEVMRDAGLRPTRLHYAIVMGGFITNRNYTKAFSIRDKMRAAGYNDSASTSQLEMKASVQYNRIQFPRGTAQQQLRQALEIFASAMSSMDMQDIVGTPRKGDGGLPINIAYSTMFYNYIIFVLGQCKDFSAAGAAYEAYRSLFPNEAAKDPISILTALMSVAMGQKEFDKVDYYWKLAFSQAVEKGRPLLHKNSNGNPGVKLGTIPVRGEVLPHHQLALSRPFHIYMQSLIQQRRSEDLSTAVKQLIEAGFVMDNRNWNIYIVSLTRRWRYPKDAFTLCESQLMPKWTGWVQLRYQAPERSRLPVSVRRTKYQGRYTRPFVSTLLWLSRAFLDLQASAADDTRAQSILDDIKHECPVTVRAITTRPRLDNALERAILQEY